MSVRGWLLTLVLAAGAAHGGIYRWVDGAGQVHYSDRPHAGARQLQVRPDAVAGPSADRLELRRRLLRAYDEEHAQNEAKAARARKAEARRRRNCLRAREELKADTDAGYLYDYDAAGNRRILTDRERTAAEANARAAVRSWCQ